MYWQNITCRATMCRYHVSNMKYATDLPDKIRSVGCWRTMIVEHDGKGQCVSFELKEGE